MIIAERILHSLSLLAVPTGSGPVKTRSNPVKTPIGAVEKVKHELLKLRV